MKDKVLNNAYKEELNNAYIFSNIICKGIPLHANYVCSCGFNYGSKFTWIERDWVNEGCPECDSYEVLQNLPNTEKEDISTFLKIIYTERNKIKKEFNCK